MSAVLGIRPVLEVRKLVTRFYTEERTVHAVNGISFSVDAGETLAIVGESGSGKTVSALSIMGLLPRPAGKVKGGEIFLGERDILTLSPSDWRKVRGREIAMVFQEPMTSLNPVLSIGYQLAEGLKRHLGLTGKEAEARAADMLDMVGIANPRSRLSDHPHQLSGGQRQRVMIAMALACEPSLLIADEPTTALDVTIQAQIAALMEKLQETFGMAVIWITHDLALVAGLAHKVAVMYAGHIVEKASVEELYRQPRHPYTQGLLASMPKLDGPRRERLDSIPGHPPDLGSPFGFCPFAPRCPRAVEKCWSEKPELQPVQPGHSAACWRWEELE
jgi:oligopeptide transport system ATP-binding protein